MIAEDYYSCLKEVFTNYDLLKYKSSLSAVQYIELYDKAIDLSLVQRADNLNLVLPYTHGQSCFVNLAECVYSKSYRIIIAREELASHYCKAVYDLLNT